MVHTFISTVVELLKNATALPWAQSKSVCSNRIENQTQLFFESNPLTAMPLFISAIPRRSSYGYKFCARAEVRELVVSSQ